MQAKTVRFQRWHLEHIRDKAVEPDQFTHNPEMLAAMERSPNNWTVVADGLPVACGGTLVLWPGRNLAWAVLGADARKHQLAVARTARVILDRAQGRIECTVRADFPAGLGWAKLLGFRVEAPLMEKFGPLGEDHVGLVRIN